MNRIIKFRAWDKEGNNYSNWKPQMIYQYEWALKIESPGDIFPLPYNNKRFEWMQFTGFHDKNGEEIFEGDVVSVGVIAGKGQFPYDGETKERYVSVIWSDFRASWTLKFSELANNDLYRYVNYGNVIEVVGNIYEHKHLLP